MDLLSIVVTVVVGAISVLATWLVGRYYYFKANPEQTAVRGLVAAARQEVAAHGNAPSADASEMPWRMGLNLIEAYEKGEIYLPELAVGAKALGDISNPILESLGTAYKTAARAGMTLSPPWQEAYERAVHEGLSAIKAELMRKLKRG